MLEFNARKFKFLSERRAQADAVSFDLGERIAELKRDIGKLSAIDREAHPNYPARGLSPTDKQRLTEMRSDMDMLEDERQRVQDQVAAYSPVVTRLEQHLADLRRDHGKHRVVAGEYSLPVKAADIARGRKQLAAVQSKIEPLIQQREDVELAPLPRAEAMERINRWVDEQAAQFNGRDVPLSASENQQIHGESFSLQGIAVGNDGVSSFSLSIAPALCWLFGDQVRHRLESELPSDTGAIPAADRPAILAEIDAKLRKLGAEEEMVIDSIEAAGELVHRRPDFDPAIVLEVREAPDRPAPSKTGRQPGGFTTKGRSRTRSSMVSDRDALRAELDAGD